MDPNIRLIRNFLGLSRKGVEQYSSFCLFWLGGAIWNNSNISLEPSFCVLFYTDLILFWSVKFPCDAEHHVEEPGPGGDQAHRLWPRQEDAGRKSQVIISTYLSHHKNTYQK
jgi:hypothetical protein